MFDSVVLNEASLPFQSLQDCRDNIKYFFDLLHEAKNNDIQFSRVDNLEGDWNQLNYADDFSFDKWFNSIQDIDRQRQIKSVLANLKCPLVNINLNKSNFDARDVLFLHESNRDSEVFGLAFAHLNSSHSLSIASQACWIQSTVPIVKAWYEGDQYHELEIDVPNISSVQQLQPFIESFKHLRQQNKAYLANLQNYNNNDFKNLIFTDSFLKSVSSSSLQPIDFKRLIAVLESLNKAIVKSKNMQELEMESSLTITDESKPTMADRSLARLRRFKHPTLGDTIFESHIKNFVNGKRMHILADYNEKTICIGYFGNHLKTSGSK